MGLYAQAAESDMRSFKSALASSNIDAPRMRRKTKAGHGAEIWVQGASREVHEIAREMFPMPGHRVGNQMGMGDFYIDILAPSFVPLNTLVRFPTEEGSLTGRVVGYLAGGRDLKIQTEHGPQAFQVDADLVSFLRDTPGGGMGAQRKRVTLDEDDIEIDDDTYARVTASGDVWVLNRNGELLGVTHSVDEARREYGPSDDLDEWADDAHGVDGGGLRGIGNAMRKFWGP